MAASSFDQEFMRLRFMQSIAIAVRWISLRLCVSAVKKCIWIYRGGAETFPDYGATHDAAADL
jgi:hypothetical protein